MVPIDEYACNAISNAGRMSQISPPVNGEKSTTCGQQVPLEESSTPPEGQGSLESTPFPNFNTTKHLTCSKVDGATELSILLNCTMAAWSRECGGRACTWNKVTAIPSILQKGIQVSDTWTVYHIIEHEYPPSPSRVLLPEVPSNCCSPATSQRIVPSTISRPAPNLSQTRNLQLPLTLPTFPLSRPHILPRQPHLLTTTPCQQSSKQAPPLLLNFHRILYILFRGT